jgi:hypothetical protein
MQLRRAILAAVLATAVAGCGGSSSHNKEIPSVPPTPAASTTTSSEPASTLPPQPLANPKAADDAKAQSLVLRQADLPGTWTATPHEKSADSQAQSAQLAACLGLPDPLTTETADVDSPDFSMGADPNKITVESNADLLQTADQAKADFAAFGGPALETCLKTLFGQIIQSGISARNVSLASVTYDRLPVKNYADATIGLRLSATLVGPSGRATLYQDLILMRKDRAEVTLVFASSGDAPPAELEQAVIDTAGTRLETS